MGDLGLEHPFSLSGGIVHGQPAIAIVNLENRSGVVVDAPAGKRGVGLGHLEGRHRIDAQRDGTGARQIGMDAHLLRNRSHGVGPERQTEARETGIRGHGECTRDAAGAVLRLVDVLDGPPGELAVAEQLMRVCGSIPALIAATRVNVLNEEPD